MLPVLVVYNPINRHDNNTKEERVITIYTNFYVWEDDFPPVYAHTSISFLKHCPGFEEAKQGDMQAALSVVNMCIKPKRIAEFNQSYPRAITLPVISKNRLPEALARQLGARMHMEVTESGAQNRKALSAVERLLHKPRFSGRIDEGESYVIVDDIVTQGGTVSELRKYVLDCGGSVAAIVALAFSKDSSVIAPTFQDVHNLNDRFPLILINEILREYNIANDISELTRSQIKCLLRFKKTERIMTSMARVREKYNIIKCH